MSDDMELVREFAASRSDAAFAMLVERHIGLVHSAALRQTGDGHLAEEISQTVFILLARKAPSLGPKTVLAAWLYRTTRYAAADALKARHRRWVREQAACRESSVNQPESETEAWTHLAPLLDDALAELGETDRAALVLRYIENKTPRQIAGELRLEEWAARKRVTRGLEKLRAILVKRGVTLTTAVIAGAMAANAVQAAPAGLAGTVAAAAVQGAAAGGSTLTLIQGALKIMAWTKMKTAVATGIVVILAAGTTTVLMEKTGDATPLITQGWQLLQAGQRQEALGMFDRAVKIDPQNPAAWNGLGWALFNSGRSAEAEPDFQKVLTLNPDFPAALNGLGQLNLSRKRYAEAEAFLLKAAPQAPAAWFGLARLYLLQGQFAAAETWAQQIVESGQGDDTARQMLQAAKDKKLSPALRLIIEPQ